MKMSMSPEKANHPNKAMLDKRGAYLSSNEQDDQEQGQWAPTGAFTWTASPSKCSSIFG
jgi:hypothetical protein